jgi:hypothetical protein
LANLVPDYLNELPADPFAADGATFHYLPHDDRPRLYSVGPDGVDSGGMVRLGPDGDWYKEDMDIAFSLDGKKPPE